jgi:hypothetical protein
MFPVPHVTGVALRIREVYRLATHVVAVDRFEK